MDVLIYIYHLNLSHGASQGSNRFPAPAAGDLLEELELPDPTLNQREVTFRFGDYGEYGDGIKDYWAEVVEWNSVEPFFPFTFQTNFFGFNPFSYQVFDPSGPVSVVLTPLEPTLNSTSWILSDLPVFYDVVRHGKPSAPWEGGSFTASFGIAPNLDNDDFIVIDPEIVEISDGTITLKLELPASESESGIIYVPRIKTSTGTHKEPLQGH